MGELVFLKLGGSLITDKTRPYTVRADRLDALMVEIADAMSRNPQLRLLIGHGSGSFGHYAVKDHLRHLANPLVAGADGAASAKYWRGYAEVRYRAAQLNHYFMEAMYRAKIPAMALQPSAMVEASDGMIASWDLTALHGVLETSLVPVIYGDIVMDSVRASTVLSTEALMIHLVPELRPSRILLAGLEAAVWADYPARTNAIDKITPGSYRAISGSVGGSHGTDVTGGMKAKVEEMLSILETTPTLTVKIFSGEEPGNVAKALSGVPLGTTLVSD